MSDKDPSRIRPPKFNLLEATFALAQKEGLTFAEARRELGRRGAAVRARKNLRIKNHARLLQRKGLQ
jgi:hypothetical protein